MFEDEAPTPEQKRELHDALSRLAGCSAQDSRLVLDRYFAPNVVWRASHPLNQIDGIEAVDENVWKPLKQAMPDMERRDAIFLGGVYEGRRYMAALGHYCGTLRSGWLTIPATDKVAWLRYGEVYELREGKIVQANCLWDILDLVRQVGYWPLAPSLGVETLWPGPITGDGLAFREADPAQSAASLAQTLAMQATLGAYDDRGARGRAGLLEMPQRDHWHPKMMWYGPAGIGAARGLPGFVDDHQLPFRRAFPNRKGGGQWSEIAKERARLGGGHYIRIGDGPYSVTGGWPSVFAEHTGGGFLGLPPTGKVVTMRVMDFYLHDEGRIRENWVPLDVLDLLMQMGFDLMERLPSHRRHLR